MDGEGPAARTIPAKQPAPKIKSFACLQCGMPVTLRGMLQTSSVVCAGCGTVIDVTDENLQIIGAFLSKIKVEPAIPLGTRGQLRDGTFEVIGFMRRVIEVEGVGYRWREYLLFNPYKGFRWLSEYNGHWNCIRTSLYRPLLVSGGAHFKGLAFRHFQSAVAKVDYVVGEFYWRVQVGESCLVQDFIAPPQILSMEQTDKEITWSLGEYVEPDVIAKAFNLKKPLPARIGVGANQPSPHASRLSVLLKRTLVFMAVAVLIQLLSLIGSQNKLVYQQSFDYDVRDSEKSRVSELFELPGRTSNVVIRTKADVRNNWLYLNMALINDETGTAYDFGREIDYYFGRDSDGSWTEGKPSDEAAILHVPPGRYYLRVEPDGPAPAHYSVAVYRDVPQWLAFFLALIALTLIPVIAFWRSRSFEYQRWSESDHPSTSISDMVHKVSDSGDDD